MWGGGQAREMEELRPCVCRPVCPLCVCVCVFEGPVGGGAGGHEAGGQGSSDPPAPPAPSRGGECWRASMTWALMGKRLRGHRVERRTPRCPKAPVLCPQPHLGGEPLLPGAAGKQSLPSG